MTRDESVKRWRTFWRRYKRNRLAAIAFWALAAVMAEALYFLQYHLYVVALHRYLEVRLPGYRYETHFGGIFYCFLRGMDPAWGPTYGVFRDRPPAGLVEALCDLLIEQ